jgi:hypothetical protein
LGEELSETFGVAAPSRFRAVELRRTELNGRTRPLRVLCEVGTELREVIVKLKDPMVPDITPWPLCLARELVGSLIAQGMGLPTPPIGIVEISEGFVRSAEGTDEHERRAQCWS